MPKANSLIHLFNKFVEFIGSRYFYIFILVWFVIQATIIAIITKFGLPPDESFHFNLIKLYAESGVTPFLDSQEGYYWLGDVIRKPSILYHYAMSWPYRLLDGLPATYVYLRFINIGFAVGTLMLVKKLAKQLELSGFVANLSLFMLVNTLMFTFLSAAISYDNPLIMLTMLSLVLLVSLMKNFRSMTFLFLVLVMLVTSVVKFTFLPIALFIAVVFVAYYKRGIGSKAKLILKDIKDNLFTKQTMFILLLILISLVFVSERYGVNVVEYGSIRVECTEVHSIEDCRKRPIFQRSEKVEAMNREPTLSIPEFSLKWAATAKERIYGVFAHESTKSTTFVSYGTWIIIGLMGIALIQKYKWERKPLNYLVIISFAYVVVAAAKNFLGYQNTGIFGMGLQGRYIFPVLPMLYLAGNYYVEKWLKNRRFLLPTYALLTICVFIVAGLPSYLYLTNLGWFSDKLHPFLDNFIIM